MEKFWGILKKSIGGFLGVTGFLLSLILVPIYLFFLLNEKPRIEKRWKDYLPLRASPLKDEVAEVLSEINKYVTAYFRGQLLVCVVDGVLIGRALTLFGSQFCASDWGDCCHPDDGAVHRDTLSAGCPAVLIAAFQWGDWRTPHRCNVDFHRDTESRRHILCAPHCGKFCRPASNDSDRVDLCLGPDNRWSARAAPGRAVDRNNQRFCWRGTSGARRLREEVMESIEEVPVVAESEAATHA